MYNNIIQLSFTSLKIKMIRFLSSKGMILMAVFPFNTGSNEKYDRPVNKIMKPLLEDELGWDRVKRIFKFDENGAFTKELQSIINLTVVGGLTGMILGGLSESTNTAYNFIANNEATRYVNHFEARRKLQEEVFKSFMWRGIKMGRKLGLFCLMFSTITTCTTAYRGRLAVENYIFGGSVTGFLNRMNLGLRASLVGAGLGGALGGICGGVTVAILYLTGTNMDEILKVQHDWTLKREEAAEEQIRTYMAENEDIAEKKLFEKNQKQKILEQEYQESRRKIENPNT